MNLQGLGGLNIAAKSNLIMEGTIFIIEGLGTNLLNKNPMISRTRGHVGYGIVNVGVQKASIDSPVCSLLLVYGLVSVTNYLSFLIVYDGNKTKR